MTRPAGRPITVRFDQPLCSCGKRTFTKTEAAKQLRNAREVRAEHGGYKPGRVECRAYECTPGSGHYHLTGQAKRKRGRR